MPLLPDNFRGIMGRVINVWCLLSKMIGIGVFLDLVLILYISYIFGSF